MNQPNFPPHAIPLHLLAALTVCAVAPACSVVIPSQSTTGAESTAVDAGADRGSGEDESTPETPSALATCTTPCGAGRQLVIHGSQCACEPCPLGAFSTPADLQCKPWTQCRPEEQEARAPTRTSDRVCTPRPPCGPGTYDETGGRRCTSCPEGTFSDRENATQCTPWSQCSPGQLEANPPDATSDRSCAPCPPGTFKARWGAGECTRWTQCSDGQIEIAHPSDTGDRVCMDAPGCPPDTYFDPAPSDGGAARCTPATACGADEREASAPTALGDRRCEPCPDGLMATGANSSECFLAFSSVEVQSAYSCGLRERDGGVVCWGHNDEGQASPPTTVGFRQIALGFQHACGIRAHDGEIECWGENRDAKLDAPEGVRFSSIAASGSHTCGIRADDGLAQCWGQSPSGQLDPPGAPEVFTQIAAGTAHYCGVLATGRVMCWGNDALDQLTAPASDLDAVSSWGFYSCGIERATRSVRCWGEYPVGLPSFPGVRDVEFELVAAGQDKLCGLDDTGSLVCWYESREDFDAPSGHVTDVGVGLDHACAIVDRRVVCWGDDTEGKATPPVEMP